MKRFALAFAVLALVACGESSGPSNFAPPSPGVWRDTTGREYLILTHLRGVAMTPRLPACETAP